MISTIDPVKGTDNKNLACGQNAQNAALVAPANPGSKMTVKWVGGGGQKVSMSLFGCDAVGDRGYAFSGRTTLVL